MNAKELRIGNIVAHDDYSGHYFKIIGIEQINQEGRAYYAINTEGGKNGYWANPDELVNPIPLTELILFKCGFQKWRNSKSEYCIEIAEKFSFIITAHTPFDNNITMIAACRISIQPYEDEEIVNAIYVHIEHLHELQNLFYTVTGRELEVDLPIS